MPSWIGTSKAASENGIGVAAAAAALVAARGYVLVRFLVLPILIDLLRRDEGSVDSFGRDAKGGIEDFLEPVGRLASELVGLCVGHERLPAGQWQPLGHDLLGQQDRIGMVRGAIPRDGIGAPGSAPRSLAGPSRQAGVRNRPRPPRSAGPYRARNTRRRGSAPRVAFAASASWPCGVRTRSACCPCPPRDLGYQRCRGDRPCRDRGDCRG